MSKMTIPALATIGNTSRPNCTSREVVSLTNQLKLLAPDGKRRLTDVLDYKGVMLLAQNIPNTNATRFVHWFTSDSESIDGRCRDKAYALWDSGMMENVEIGTTRGLQQIHA